MRTALIQKSAAVSSARVQFEVIENPDVSESPPSVDDYSLAHCIESVEIPHVDSAGCHWHKPSVFYMRRELRRATDRRRIAAIVDIALQEAVQLARWAADREIPDAEVRHAMFRAMKFAFDGRAWNAQDIAAGLALCTELERLQAHVASHGLIPPKWFVVSEEAAEKGFHGAAGGA